MDIERWLKKLTILLEQLPMHQSISVALWSMAVKHSSRFRPAVHDQHAARWELEGYSWIESKKVGEPCSSPELFEIGGSSFRLEVYPGGLNEASSEWISVVAHVSRGSGTLELEMSLKLVSQKHGTPDFTFCKQRTDGLKIDDGRFVAGSVIGPKWACRKTVQQAESYCKDGTMFFELDVTVWFEDVVANHKRARNDCADALRTDRSKLVADITNLFQDSDHSDVALLPSGKDRAMPCAHTASFWLHARRSSSRCFLEQA